MIRRLTLLLLTLGVALPLHSAPARAGTDAPIPITVYRSPTCGCCGKWMEHMRRNGFAVSEIQSGDMDAIKRQHGVPDNLKSCHTALTAGHDDGGACGARTARTFGQHCENWGSAKSPPMDRPHTVTCLQRFIMSKTASLAA